MSEAEDILAKARVYIRSKAPYLMPVVLGLIPVESKLLLTMAVTARMVMLYNPEWVVKHTFEQIAAVLVHECSHVLREHHKRFKQITDPHDKKIANIAMDIAINPDLRSTGWSLPNCALYPSHYKLDDGLIAEEYYALLKKLADQNKIVIKGPKGEGSGEEDGEDGGGVASGECGSCAGQKSDEEQQSNDDAFGRENIDVQGILKKTAQEIKDFASSKGRGSVPGLFQELADFILEEKKVDWRHVFAQVVRRVTGKIRSGGLDFSLRRPSKRSYARGLLRPGLIQQNPEVCIIRDTSGSMGKAQLQEATSEACHILQLCGIEQAWFFDADTQGSSPQRVSLQQLLKLPITGRGGTDFHGPLAQAAKLNPKPDVIIYMTDGDGGAPEHPPAGVEVIWCIVNSYYNKAPAEWGHAVILNDGKPTK